MTILEIKTDWEYFVGDPCYVLSKEQYSHMENKLRKVSYPVSVSIPTTFDEIPAKWALCEIHSSPGGDGCWEFKHQKPSECVGGEEIGVDSGLIAIIPRYMLKREPSEQEGLFFMEYPQLDTADDDRWGTRQAAPVIINNTPCDGYAQCAGCSDYSEESDLEDCDGCANAFCQNCWCGCDEEE